jgi:hypothetical protein
MPSKSAKLSSKALEKAKKALRKFTGQLSSPILVPRRLGEWGPLSSISLQREIAQQRQAKFSLLFEHYRIQSNDKDRWRELATRLAVDLVPGMITIEQRSSPYKKKSSHKDQIWTSDRYADLVREVELLRGENKKIKIFTAVDDLVKQQPKKWGEYKDRQESLVTLYHEGKRKLKKEANLNASIGRWKPSQT